MKKLLISSKGSALTMALIGALGLGALSLVILNRAKTANRIGERYSADADVDAAVLQLTAFLLKPKNCTATFKGLAVPPLDSATPPTGGPLLAIKSCNTGNCDSGGTSTAAFSVVDKDSADWSTATTGFAGMSQGNSNSKSRIRLTKMNIWMTRDQTYIPGVPALLRVQLIFQKQVGLSAKHVSGSNFSAELKTSTVARDIFVPVVRARRLTSSPWYQTSTTILGCAKSPNSTTVYSGS